MTQREIVNRLREIEFEENIENMLDYLENENESEDVEEDGKQEE